MPRWSCKERFPGGRVTVNMADFAPDVAFEILSPSNSPSTIQEAQRLSGKRRRPGLD